MVDDFRPKIDGLIQRGIHSRMSDLDRLDAQAVKHFRLSGRTQVIGTGESSVTVTFPVTFIGRPAFSFGGELAKNQTAILKSIGANQPLPTVSVIVAEWDTVKRLDGVFNYVGATLVLVTTNNPRYMWVHWHVDGKAFQNPLPYTADELEQ